MTSRIHHGDSLTVLRTLPAESVHCVVTSPPYWSLRDYDVDGQIGLEEQMDCSWHLIPAVFRDILAEHGIGPCGECFVCRLIAVFAEVRRVLRKDGVAWVNMGDCYSVGTNSKESFRWDKIQVCPRGRAKFQGLPAKNLLGQPWRLALALQSAGWILRSDIVWHKPTAMPEAVEDRPTKAHEYVFLLSKSARYFYDATAIKEPVTGGAQPRGCGVNRKAQKVPAGWDTSKGSGAHGAIHRNGRSAPENRPRQNSSFTAAVSGLVETRNRRTVWTIPAARFSGAHFATFPPELAAVCIKAGTSEVGVCPACGAPWIRETETRRVPDRPGRVQNRQGDTLSVAHAQDGRSGNRWNKATRTTGWAPACSCDAGEPVQAVVLDPFIGAGTTGLVARKLGRSFVGIELNPDTCIMARDRIMRETGLFGPVEIIETHPNPTTMEEMAS